MSNCWVLQAPAGGSAAITWTQSCVSTSGEGLGRLVVPAAADTPTGTGKLRDKAHSHAAAYHTARTPRAEQQDGVVRTFGSSQGYGVLIARWRGYCCWPAAWAALPLQQGSTVVAFEATHEATRQLGVFRDATACATYTPTRRSPWGALGVTGARLALAVRLSGLLLLLAAASAAVFFFFALPSTSLPASQAAVANATQTSGDSSGTRVMVSAVGGGGVPAGRESGGG